MKSESWNLSTTGAGLQCPCERGVRAILGVSNSQQWEQRITSQEIRQRWGDTATVTQKVAACRLEWLGPLAQMPEHRIPQKYL